MLRVIRNPMGLLSIGTLIVVALTAAIGAFVAPFDPNATNLAEAFSDPDRTNWLGRDSAGRDVFSRLIIGAEPTMLSAALAATVAIGIGLPAGLMAGYRGGVFDSVSNWICDTLMALPSIIVLLAVSAALGQSVWITMTVFGVMMTPSIYRVTRTTVRAVRDELYVDAARVSGVGTGRIIGRHVLRVVRAPVIIQASMICGVAVTIQASLEFLGLGDPLTPTWGAMLNEAFLNIYMAPMLTLWPAVTLTVTIGAFVVLGNALRDALEDSTDIKARRSAAPTDVTRAPKAAGALLEVQDLTVTYPDRGDAAIRNVVVRDLSFEVLESQVLGIVGESGSGKTQTVFSIMNLLPNDAQYAQGAIYLDGQQLSGSRDSGKPAAASRSARGRRIAYIPQEPMSNLDPNFTVGYQLVRPLTRVLGLPKARAERRALELLARVGIHDPAKVFSSYPHQLSGGMAQRVLIAGAVSGEPDLLLADEPTTSLDVTVQAEVLDLLRDLQAEYNLAIVFVTHNLGVVADICTDVIVMKDGKIVERGSVRDVLENPQHDYTRHLLDSSLHGKEPMQFLVSEDR